MLRILLLLMIFFLGHGLSVAAPSLHQGGIKKVTQKAGYHYWYYRNAKVYFDKKNRVYFYRYKNRWRRVKRLPSWIKLDAYRVPISMRTNRPYSQHTRHVRRYPPKRVVFNNKQPRKRLRYPNQQKVAPQAIASKPAQKPQNNGEATMWYSPAKKVFYNQQTKEYAYLNRSWHWQRSKKLPSNIKVDRYPKIPLSSGASMPRINERFNTRKVNMIVQQNRVDKPAGNKNAQNKYVRSQPARVNRKPYKRPRYPAGPNPGVKSYTYHFYPNSQVYHDPNRGIYFYLRGKRWVANTSLPKTYKLKGDYAKLNSPQMVPYKMNAQHLKQYPPR